MRVKLLSALLLLLIPCFHTKAELKCLEKKLEAFAAECDGKVGIAVITSSGDTLTVNNDVHYPLMSVFKLHQALAVADALDKRNIQLDSLIHINRKDLNRNTWSPMMKDYMDNEFDISVGNLLGYTLQQSDNNASNLLFDCITSVAETDSFIRKRVNIADFRLNYTEHQMQQNHESSRMNWSSPLACAILIDRTVNEKLVSTEKQETIRRLLRECNTGTDRLKVAFEHGNGTALYHKTGSGYRDSNGRLMAHNDIGYAAMPDGRGYAIAVLITDFNGSNAEASAIIAEISKTVYQTLEPGT